MAVLEILGKVMLKIFGSSSGRYVKSRGEFVRAVNALEESYGRLGDNELGNKTEELRAEIKRLEEEIIGGKLREKLKSFPSMPEEARKPAKKELALQLRQCCDGILAEAFAAVREVSDRHLGVRNVFKDMADFDESALSAEMQAVYREVKEKVSAGEDVHKIELPAEFYKEVRQKYPVESRSVFRFRHFDVQLIGGAVLYEGKIAEMATGEGKTLVATLAAYVVALSGRKVHVITVNDYLAQRDRDWMAPVYEALGLTVGAIQSDMDTAGAERKKQYDCDITYGTNNEFGFDYLRDNMKVKFEQQVQGPLDYCIVDEVDSILIDEARTPLIISGPAFDDTSRYKQADKIANDLMRLQKGYSDTAKQIDHAKRIIANTQGEISEAKKAKDDERVKKAQRQLEQLQETLAELENKLTRATQYYEVEYDRHSVHLTHEGIGAAQDIAGIGSFYVGANMEWPHLMEQALRAHVVFEKEKDYVVQDNEVIIVDEFTGRLMHGRQWSDGLHQAVEAKENVSVKEESQTLATITLQNFFKMYHELAGMTGTAMTEQDEFMNIYQLAVVAIPTNKPIIREDYNDLIYKSMPEKFSAIVDEIHNMSKSGRPVLIGTISIEKNEALSDALTKRHGLDHEVLNAKQHAREAAIVAKAGQQHTWRDGQTWGNVTIATNMAGRGTDIKLTPEVVNAGGLAVVGTERHEARRIDNQLRGRCGRQGDPGSSQFFLSFDDDLVSVFAPEWTVKALAWIGWQEGEPIEHGRISKGIERAQKKVEQRNFEARKSLLEYDEVMDYQRQVFYTRRQKILEGRGLEGLIWGMIGEVVADACGKMLGRNYAYECIVEWARQSLGVEIELDRIKGSDYEEMAEVLLDRRRNNVDQEITITLGEYMAEDIASEEWDLRGLSKWAMSKFSVNVSQNQLRKMTMDEVREKLLEAANEQINKFDCSGIMAFLDDGFARKSLCDWVNQKFALQVKAEDLSGKSPEAVEKFLLERARQGYHRREIEYPVDFILNMSLRHQQAGSSYAAGVIVDWAKDKYGEEMSLDEVRQLSYDKLREKLLGLSESHNAGDISEEARQRLRSELTELEKYVLLQIYDLTWKDHLYSMDHLKGSIGLRGFAEKDPKIEYKREGYRMFQDMLGNIRDKVTDMIFKAQLSSGQETRSVWNIASADHSEYSQFEAQQAAGQMPQGQQAIKTIKLEKPKVGRNELCPCGSGKKYKKCCGKNQ